MTKKKIKTPKYLSLRNNEWVLYDPETGKRKQIDLVYDGTAKNRDKAIYIRDQKLAAHTKKKIAKDINEGYKNVAAGMLESNKQLSNITLNIGEDMRLSVATQRCYDEQWINNQRDKEPVRLIGKLIKELGDPFLSEITAPQIMDIRKAMDKRLAIATVNRHMSALKTLLTKAQREWQILPYIIYIPIYKEPAGRVRYMKPEEELKIYQLLRDRKPYHNRKNIYPDYVDLFMYLMDTGTRINSEAFIQPVQNINFKTRKIYVYGKKTDTYRTIPMTDRVYDICYRRRDNKLLFDDLVYTSVSEYIWPYILKGLDIKKEDDPEFVPYCIRHTYCSNLWNDGVDVQLIMKYMGHSNIKTTLRYAHLDEDKAESFAIEKLNARSQSIMNIYNK